MHCLPAISRIYWFSKVGRGPAGNDAAFTADMVQARVAGAGLWRSDWRFVTP